MTDAAAAATAAATTANASAGAPAPVAPTPAPAPAPAVSPGEAGFTVPAELLDWGANKGYNKDAMTKLMTENPDIYKMANSYRETEKHLHNATGADKFSIPKDVNDFTQVAPALEKLGAPKDASGYKMEVPQGVDSAFAVAASQKFAEVKLLPAQATALNAWWNEQMAAATTANATKTAQAATASAQELTQEWGINEKINSEVAGRGLNAAAKEIGMTPERVAEIQNGNGPTLTVKEAAKLFKFVGELTKSTSDNFEGAEPGSKPGGQSGHTPESAKAEKNRLMGDPAYARRYLSKEEAAVKQIRTLEAIEAQGLGNITNY